MATMCEHHKKLTNGKGKCSVPQWVAGMPGFCGKDAFGFRPECKELRPYVGLTIRQDGKYSGYVPGLACPGHGGPQCHEGGMRWQE